MDVGNKLAQKREFVGERGIPKGGRILEASKSLSQRDNLKISSLERKKIISPML